MIQYLLWYFLPSISSASLEFWIWRSIVFLYLPDLRLAVRVLYILGVLFNFFVLVSTLPFSGCFYIKGIFFVGVFIFSRFIIIYSHWLGYKYAYNIAVTGNAMYCRPSMMLLLDHRMNQ